MASAQEVAATLKLAIEREQDLLVSGAAFASEQPDAVPARFWRWAADVQAIKRYPELEGIVEIALVPAKRLPAWMARVRSEALQPGPPLPFRLLPGGSRPYYCLISAAVGIAPTPPGYDACVLSPLVYASRDSGASFTYPIVIAGIGRWLGFGLPVYRTAVAPRTVAARRASFVGWVGLAVFPDTLLDQALQGHPGLRIVLHRGRGSALAFAAGHAPARPLSITIDLHNGSTVQVLGEVTSAGIFASANSTLVLLGGIALSLSLATLLYVLGTGRARALRLVKEKTEQLSFQALHDGLTGLPNRLLVLDRASQALARARRTREPAAAMFIDIDAFKRVNDTLGHAAGDQLLRVIAARLTAVLRDSDTVGRFGGDEFVVLLDPQDNPSPPELVAERILHVLAQPIDVADGKTVTVSASIGIATGPAIAQITCCATPTWRSTSEVGWEGPLHVL